MGLPAHQRSRIRTAAALHDVGKIETPQAILHKPAALSDAEYETIKRHPVDGARMVAVLDDQQLTEMVRSHHERLDGSGYPLALTARELTMPMRVLAVADMYEALTADRPYRPAWSAADALSIIGNDVPRRVDGHAFAALETLVADPAGESYPLESAASSEPAPGERQPVSARAGAERPAPTASQ
jgi:HD-GYP domain-containing protein (c-di-GMP phosphodiesterase class II)